MPGFLRYGLMRHTLGVVGAGGAGPMSMWRVGREAVRISDPIMTPLDRSVAYTRAASDGTGGPLGDIVDTVTKWIPGEVLALYAAGVTMIGHPSWFWLVVGILLAPLVVVLGAFANSGKLPTDQKIQVRAYLALVSMLLWSLVVPGSGWWSWSVIGRNPAAVALAGGALGLIFGLVAEGVSRWVDSVPAKPAPPQGPAPNSWAAAPAPQPEPVTDSGPAARDDEPEAVRTDDASGGAEVPTTGAPAPTGLLDQPSERVRLREESGGIPDPRRTR
jgi:hypothetical protein